MIAAITRRKLLASVAALALTRKANAGMAFMPAWYNSSALIWNALPVGGGGYQSKMQITASGMIFSSPDTFGGYIGSTALGVSHQQIITPSSFPSGYSGTPYFAGNFYDLAVDPNNDNALWAYYCPTEGGTAISTVIKSTDKGASWNLTGFPLTSAAGNWSANGTSHPSVSQQLVVDPNNSNVVYVGGYDALRRTLDGGTTFSTVSAITAPGTNPGVCAIAFDPTSGTTTLSGATVTKRILIGVFGTGVFVSTDGGSTFNQIASSPTSPIRGVMASDGNYYVVNNGSSTITRIDTANALHSITCNTAIGSFAIDPADPSHAIAWDNIGGGCVTFDGAINGATPPAGTHNATSSISITANDCPWLALTGHPSLGPIIWDQQVDTCSTSITIGVASNVNVTFGTNKNYIAGDLIRLHNTGTVTNYMLCTVVSYTPSTGAAVINTGSYDEGTAGTFPYLGQATGGSGTFSAWTVTKERLWYACGVGMIFIDAPSYGGALTYTSHTFGIETLSSAAVFWPNSSTNYPQLIASDFPWFPVSANPVGQSTGASSYQPTAAHGSIVDGASLCAAISDESTLFGIAGSFTGTSTNKGAAWSSFSAAPTIGSQSADVAASTDSSIVFASRNSSTVSYTTNGGASWGSGSGQTAGSPGGGFAQYSQQVKFLQADTVTPSTYYRYSSPNIDRSTDGGATWTAWATGLTSNNNIVQMQAVPGHAGHLFISFGPQGNAATTWSGVLSNHPAIGGPASGNWELFFINGGTFTALPNTGEVLCFGIGAPKPGGNGYPTIYFAGWVKVAGTWAYSPMWAVYNFDPTNIAGTTYTNLDGFASNAMDVPNQIAADMNTFGFAIEAYNGSGWSFYGHSGTWP